MSQQHAKLSEQVRQAIQECGLSQYRIAKEMGIPKMTLSFFMNERRGLPMKTLDRLAEFLDLNIARGEGYPPVLPGVAGETEAKSGSSTRRSTSRPASRRRRRPTEGR
ncbi:MAG: helix-turn-helix transcriptional regulator [Phycisphaeraceae bacterium]